ncbi:hypothetical protein CTI12_AA354330 [Artemisia annua]|uniref:Uncharacterized protein n=1 Tax=Artemisia annua TaxID=35608 RepID=A0A2U1MQJ7_ARTAN|nr:hypothetical protein CTI12_AA354330 [Artemisia annua]
MTKEEGENGRDDMLIDDPQQVEGEGFNSNYLKVYYGDRTTEVLSPWTLTPIVTIKQGGTLIATRKRHANAASGDNIFAPVERELVFDIDISDYDDARYCCSRVDVCDCWPLMTIAIKVLILYLHFPNSTEIFF